MIGYLSGTIISTNKNPIIIYVGGVGYLVHTTESLLSKLPNNSKANLYIYTHVREDALNLYGFINPEEHDLFVLLISVSGVGPKSALLVVNHSVLAVKKAVSDSDVSFFTAIPRLGKKNAQKIIIELKSKLGSYKDLDLAESASDETKDIVEALISMGFAKNDIIKSLKKLDDNDDTAEKKLRHMIKILGKPAK
ncbi:Holliday junction branch migration protein RuvA [Patescibacteria group bacterium]